MKTWKLLLAAMMALVMLFAVSALAEGGDAGDVEECLHAWDDGVITTYAKCNGEVGEITYTCTKCGATKIAAYSGEPYEHNTGAWTVQTPATCAAEGVEVKVCSWCGDVRQSRAIPKTEDHKWEVVETVIPTCDGEREGVVTSKCTVCGATKTEAFTGDEVEHNYGAWTVTTPATCVAEGVESRVCSWCGKTETKAIAIDPAAHAWDEGVTVYPTCDGEREGTVTYTCTLCGEIKVVPYEGDIVEHNFGAEHVYEGKEPTCQKEGLAWIECSWCGLKQDQILQKIDHNWVLDEEFPAIEPTCTEDGRAAQYYCDMCWLLKGGETIPATGHDWGEWKTIKEATEDEAGVQERTCANCGATQTREIGTMPETGVATVPTAALVSLMVLAMGSYVVLKKKESC